MDDTDRHEENEGNLLKTQKDYDDDQDHDESLKPIQETQKNDDDNKPLKPIEETPKRGRGRPKKEKLPKEKKPFIMTQKRREALDKGRLALQVQRQKNHVNKITGQAELIISELLKTKEGKKELEKKIKIAKLMNGDSSSDEEEPKTRRKTKPKPKNDSDEDQEHNLAKNYKEKPKITIQTTTTTTNEKPPKYTF